MGAIAEAFKQAITREEDRGPVHTNRASEIGHPCLAYLVFRRTRWDEATPLPFKLKTTFREGRCLEELTLRDLQSLGFPVSRTQVSLYDRDLQLSGTVDALAEIQGKTYLVEIKSCHPAIFERIRRFEDLLGDSRVFVRKWAYQVQAYLMLARIKELVLILRNKITGELNDIAVVPDPDIARVIADKCRRVNEAVAQGVIPEEYKSQSEDVCPDCCFSHVCLPRAIHEEGAEIIDDPDLLEALETREALREAYRAYIEADKLINKRLRGKRLVLCGPFVIRGQMIHRRGYTVPDGEVWRKEIIRIGGNHD